MEPCSAMGKVALTCRERNNRRGCFILDKDCGRSEDVATQQEVDGKCKRANWQRLHLDVTLRGERDGGGVELASPRAFVPAGAADPRGRSTAGADGRHRGPARPVSF